MDGRVTAAYVLSDSDADPHPLSRGKKGEVYAVWRDISQMLALCKGDLATLRNTSFTYVFYDM